VSGDLEVLRHLLAIERERLDVARRIEVERSIVFPETSVIVRDIMRLVDAIAAKEGRAPQTPAGLDVPGDTNEGGPLDALLDGL
jgi:hypothetical protein